MSAAYDSMVWCCTTAVSCSEAGSNASKTQRQHNLHLRAHWRTTLPGIPMNAFSLSKQQQQQHQ